MTSTTSATVSAAVCSAGVMCKPRAFSDLKRKFVAMCKHNSGRERQLHVHVTCATVRTCSSAMSCCV